MRLTIKPEHTGKDNYTNNIYCPIAMALRDKGYQDVYVSNTTWKAIKPFRLFGRELFVRRFRGFIPARTNYVATIAANVRQIIPLEIELTKGSGLYFDNPELFTHE